MKILTNIEAIVKDFINLKRNIIIFCLSIHFRFKKKNKSLSILFQVFNNTLILAKIKIPRNYIPLIFD